MTREDNGPMDDTSSLITFINARFDEDAEVARAAAEPESWVELNRQPRPRWYIQHWADPDVTAIIADPESSAYPVAVTVQGMEQVDADARVKHVARHDPARVLREVEGKRKLLEAFASERHAVLAPGGSTEIYCPADYDTGEPCDCGLDERVGQYLRLAALPYDDHPDYRQEWTL